MQLQETKDFGLLIKSCYVFKNLMDFLDSGIFEVALHKIVNKTCSVYFYQVFTLVQDQKDYFGL